MAWNNDYQFYIIISVERRQLVAVKPDVTAEELWEEQSVITLADLQERQLLALNNAQEAVFNKVRFIQCLWYLDLFDCLVFV